MPVPALAGALMLAIKLTDLALAGGEWAIRAQAGRDRLEAALRTGDDAHIAAEIKAVEAETDRLLADLLAAKNRPPASTPEALRDPHEGLE